MKLNIRSASAADVSAVNAIYGYYIENTLINFGEHNKADAERAAEMEALLPSYPFLIAEADGQMAGFACAEAFRPQSGYRYTAELTIYLHPDAPKGKGIGSALYSHLLNELKERGFHTAVAVLYAENSASLALHRKFGFTQTGVWKEYGCKNGMWLDAVLMEKRL